MSVVVKYEVDTYGANEDKERVTIDLTSIQTKDIDVTKLKRDNRYEFTTPSGNKITFKLLTHGDEQKIDADIKALAKFNKGGISSELTTRYRYMIQEVDGKTDTKSITDFINNIFLAKDTREFREYFSDYHALSPSEKEEFVNHKRIPKEISESRFQNMKYEIISNICSEEFPQYIKKMRIRRDTL